MELSKSDNPTTQRYCSIAVANLSGHAKLRDGSVGTLVKLFKTQDARDKRDEKT
jgi:hypothetical protein